MPGGAAQGFLAGIDAGGTGVRACVVDSAGAVVWEEESRADPDGGPAPALALLRGANLPLASIAAGIAKITRTGVEASWRDALAALAPQVSVVPDYEIGFWAAAPEGVGVAVLAGTGSVAFGRNPSGESIRVGGRGWEYGDEGSGAFLTEALVRRTVRAREGLSAISPLQREVCTFLGATDAGALALAARERAAGEGRGFLAPLILDLARAGDDEARNLFVGAAGWLATLAGAALGRLGFAPDDAVEVYGVGGLWRAEELLAAPLAEVLRRRYPGAVFQVSTAAPVSGAVRLAARGNGATADLV